MGPRLFGALALTVLGACGALVLISPPHSSSLVGRSTWQLAQLLPVRSDFPAEWNYGVRGSVGWATPPHTAAADTTESSRPDPLIPTAAYAPPHCGQLPAALIPRDNRGVNVHVDTTPVGVAAAKLLWRDSVAAGDPDVDAPNADFTIAAAAEALIGKYRDWLGRCDSYRVSVFYPETRTRVERLATTTVEESDPGAALTVTRTFVDDDGGGSPPNSYRISYYPVRGLLLTCSTSMHGADADLVQRLAGRTARKLAAL